MQQDEMPAVLDGILNSDLVREHKHGRVILVFCNIKIFDFKVSLSGKITCIQNVIRPHLLRAL
jgi:hypothetical protein